MQAFLDTNVFLHFRWTEVDWAELLGDPSAQLVVAAAVIEELEREKATNPVKGLRARAATAIRKFRDLLTDNEDGRLPRGTLVRFDSQEAQLDYNSHGLVQALGDDRLLARMLELKSGRDAMCVITDDFGLQIKARRLNIQVCSLDDKDRLPDAMSEQERQIQQLQLDLEREHKRRPLLRIQFGEPPHTHIKRMVEAPIVLTPSDVAAELSALAARVPRLDLWMSAIRQGTPGWRVPTQEQAWAYNQRRDEFMQKFEEFIPLRHAAKNKERGSVKFEVGLWNEGSTPAEDIDITIRFPLELSVYPDGLNPWHLQPPSEPQRPAAVRIREDDPLGLKEEPESVTTQRLANPRPVRAKCTEHCKESEAQLLRIQVPRLKHGQHVLVASPIRVGWPSYDQARSFPMAWIVEAGNTPAASSGELHVVVDQVSNRNNGEK